MATEQVLKTRILLKYDTYENWMSSSSILKPGEVALATIDSGNTQEVNSVTPPQVLIKVGDGNHVYSALPFVSAKAADVYSWAKEADFPIEVTGSGNTITSVSWINNKLSFVKGDRVEEVTKGNAGIVIGGTKTNPTVGVVVSQETGNTLKLKNDGLYVAPPEEVTLPSYEDSAVAGQFVTEVDQVDGEISVKRSTISYEDLTNKPAINDGTLTLKAGNGLSGDDKTFSANDVDNVTFEVSHAAKPNIGTAHETTAGTGRTYVTKVDVDEFGHIAKVYTATETDQDIPNITITDDTQAEVPTTDTVNVYKNLTANGHTLTEELVTVPTKAYVDKIAAGATDYLGVVSDVEDIGALANKAGYGDFCRVSTAFEYLGLQLHAGDLLVNESQTAGVPAWAQIHGEEGDITEIVAGAGLTGGGSTGSITLNVGAGDGIIVTTDKVSVSMDSGLTVNQSGQLVAKIGNGIEFGNDDEIKVKQGNHIVVNENGVHHEAKPTTGAKLTPDSGSGRTYVTQVDVDDYGHIAKVYTATETVVDTDTDTTYDLQAPGNKENGQVTIDLKAGGSGSGTDSVKITGAGATQVTTNAAGEILVSSTDSWAGVSNNYYTKNEVNTIMNTFEGRNGIQIGYDSEKEVYYAQIDPTIIFDCGGADF